jgi:hypothetical protein
VATAHLVRKAELDALADIEVEDVGDVALVLISLVHHHHDRVVVHLPVILDG